MIYFLKAEQDSEIVRAGWIKVGTTIHLSARLKQIAVEIGRTPTVLAVLDGSFAEEQALHRKFRFTRKFGEWFGPDPELLQLIQIEGRPWDGVDEVQLGIVSLNPDVVKSAKIVSAFRGETMTAMLSDILLPILVEMELEVIAKRTEMKSKKT